MHMELILTDPILAVLGLNDRVAFAAVGRYVCPLALQQRPDSDTDPEACIFVITDFLIEMLLSGRCHALMP